MHLPHGGIVTIEYSHEIYANVYYNPSAADYGNMVGLCGTWDGDSSNDYTTPDGNILGNLDAWLLSWR